MNARTIRTIIGVALMSALLVLYLVITAYQALLLVESFQPLTLVYGLALFVAPIIGVWSLVRELVFGRQAGRLLSRYTVAHGDPMLPVINKRDREAVDALLATPIPDTWEAALLHGLTLDTVGRRREGRAAVRKAIRLGAIDSPS